MPFSKELLTAAQPYLEAVQQCDFVKAIEKNQLDKKALDYYVSQDLKYGNVETEVQAYLIIYSKKFEEQKYFSKLLTEHLGIDEYVFKGMTEQDWDSIKSAEMQPITYLYTQHLLEPVKTGNPLDILASFEAGVWIYVELVKYLAKKNVLTKDNPFYGWVECLEGDNYQSVSDGFLKIMDEEAKSTSPEHLAKVKNAFLKSCLLEWYFFDASYRQVTWADWKQNAFKGIESC
ncbi:TenA family protein [Fructilactobacillus frigidiflavus]|uniref:TenA family protein n=1 Tax=Fructilactobacillus frigidiflavus TaxID=3242688 RepID=UPI003757C711